MTRILAASILAVITCNLHAAREPRPGQADSRMRTVVYNPSEVVPLRAYLFFAQTVCFADYEVIEDVATGDAEAFQVVQNADKNCILIKPQVESARSNLFVMTSTRRYAFTLEVAGKADATNIANQVFAVEFQYPDDEIAAAEAAKRKQQVQVGAERGAAPVGPAAWNFNYSFSGSRVTKPIRVMDDGKFTYFDFGDQKVPAIFSVDSKGNESLVNFHKEGRFLVVERLDRQFTLRDGVDVTCIFNEAKGPFERTKSYRTKAPV